MMLSAKSAKKGRSTSWASILEADKQGYQYDDAGNFNYGATGTAIGIPSSVLLKGADAYKNFMNFWHNKPMNGNEPQKNDMIQKGIDYVKNECWSLISLFW
jgi:hypothetical protein